MLADFFTKPLQGHLFRRFRDVILGHCHVDTLRNDFIFPPEERVGKGRADHDATVTQCNATTVEMITDKNTDVTIANADVKHMYSENASAKEDTNDSTWKHGINEDDEQGTWVQVVDRRRKRKEQTKLRSFREAHFLETIQSTRI